jgi:hypothetical protein
VCGQVGQGVQDIGEDNVIPGLHVVSAIPVIGCKVEDMNHDNAERWLSCFRTDVLLD